MVDIAGVMIKKDNKILLHKRAFEPGKGKLDLIGGFVEKNETPDNAAIREAKEESGYNVKLIEKLPIIDYFRCQKSVTTTSEIHWWHARHSVARVTPS